MITIKTLLKEESNKSKPYMNSPVGFSCAKCKFHYKEDNEHKCGNDNYYRYKKTKTLVDDKGKPITDPTKWCSNWFQPDTK